MSKSTILVEATLELPDGRVFVIHDHPNAEYEYSQLFWWTEGNGSCDCNRSLYLNREYSLGLVGNQSYDDCLPCGDTISLKSLIVNGIALLEIK